MGWLNSGPEGDNTPETQSDRSGSPDSGNIGTINTASNSNAQIISKLASMDAAYLNQLNEVTTKMAERELNYKEELQNKDIQLQQYQKRVAAVEQRIRERDGQLSALREEKSYCTREIADLKNQLYQLVSSTYELLDFMFCVHSSFSSITVRSPMQQFEVEDMTSDKSEIENQWQAKLADSLRELSESKHALEDALQSKSDAVAKAEAAEKENNELKKKLLQKQGDQSANETELKRQLAQLQKVNAILTAQIAEERSNSSDTIKCTSKEVASLRANLRSKDDTIQSLQTRVEKYHNDITALEKELDDLREEKQQISEGKVKETANLINTLTDSTDKLKQELKDMTAKWEKQKEDYEAQVFIAERKGEEIKLLKSSLQERELEIEQDYLSNSRVTALEEELQKMDERVDELTTALNDAVEEIDNLQADVVYKEGRIASLEKEIQEASSLLEAPAGDDHETEPNSSPDRRESGNFTRLRQEIEKITRERARLESDHAHQLNLLETSKNGDIARLEKELDEVRIQLKAESEKVDSLKASLETMEQSYDSVSDELAKTREIMDQLDAEEDRELLEANQKVNELQVECDKLQSEINDLRAARLVEQANESARDEIDSENMKSLSEQLFARKEEVRLTAVKLGKTIREQEMVISDLRSELSSREKYAEELRNDLESLQLSVERGPTKRNYGMSIDPEWHDADNVTKLKFQVSTLSKEKRMIENELRAKIEARDATVRSQIENLCLVRNFY
jgi:chromosome segregation ATPase